MRERERERERGNTSMLTNTDIVIKNVLVYYYILVV